MDLDSLDDDDAQQLADRIGPHLDPGSYGDRVVLKKRQFIAAASGTLGAGALATWGVDDATAQAAGSVGTASSPVDVNAYDLDVANQISIDNIGGSGEKSSTQSIPNNDTVKMELDTAAFEQSSVVDVDLTNNNLVIQKAGVYVISCGFSWGGDIGTGTRVLLGLSLNGNNTVAHQNGDAAGFYEASASKAVSLSQGDVIDVDVRQESGGSVDLRGSVRNFVSAVLIG